jgi:glycosyltransferase involved in cell wall biosynthesis
LRILHVTPYYEQAWAYGGIPRVVSVLARGLARRGHQVTVCATDACDATSRLRGPEAGGDARGDSGGVNVRVFPNVSNALAYHYQLFLPRGLETFMRREAARFDVAHVHACHNLPGAIAARHLKRARVPYALEPHGTAPRIERRRWAKWIFDRTVGRGVLEGASRLIAVSEAERRQLHAVGAPAQAVRVISNPIDLAEFDPPPERGAFRRAQALPWDELVLYLGKWTPRKRIDLLIRAFATLERPRTGLVIAGNDMGMERALRRLVARLGLEARTRFVGLLAGRARLEALADADIVAYPAEHEIFGLVPVEAILCGTPVVVAGDSGCGEVIADAGGGRVIARGSAAALAEALRAMLAEPARWRAAAARARARVEERCGGDAVCGRLEGVYREMLERAA